ncbi:unnamed protein product [Caenorhabditis nigoni]
MRDSHVDLQKYSEDVEEIQKEAEYYLLDELVELCKKNQYPNKLRFIKSDEELFEVIYKPEKPVLVLFGPIPSEGCFYYPNLLEFQKNYVSKFEMYIRLKPFSKQMGGWSYGGYSKKGQFRSEFGTYYTLTEQLEKVHLARHSDYFKNLFFKNYADSKKEIIRLEKVVPADAFQHFLELISGGNRLNDDVVEGVLKISAMWFADVPLEKAKKYLLKNSKLAPMEKFAIAEKHNLNDLKIALFATVQSSEDLESLLPDQDVSQFQPDTILLIAKKALEVSGIDRPRPSEGPYPRKPSAQKQVESLQEELRQVRQELTRAKGEADRLRRSSQSYLSNYMLQ